MADGKAAGRVLLPEGVEPTKYSISLTPDLDRFVFDGEETVNITISKATKEIHLHSKELYIQEATLTGPDEAKVSPVGISFSLKLDTVTFSFAEDLPIGEATLHIQFQGCLNNQMAGFYRSSYNSISGEKRIMASTQLEALDARRVFPCWDEPARKATFEVTLIIPATRTAFSNMPETLSTGRADGKRLVRFQESPKMSTYLLAFCVGEFDFVQGITKHGVQIKVYTPPGKSHMGTFALQVAKDTLDLYDDFFKIPYPLPKLDMVAIPEFAMGAMENWGLVTYREVDVLIDDKKASSQQRQRVCTVITHELAHQWFGNLVTMQWWDDLWLNEGFACWMQTWAADKLFPEWSMWQQFTTDDQAAALRLDSLRSSHPIQVPIAHAEEVQQVFDAISYCKGACVVKMLYAVLGEQKFQEGLQIYMDRHQYGNTETYHLWQAWQDASGKPIKDIMASWTEQMGHPVVKVVGEEWGDSSVTLQLEQSWFLQDGSSAQEGEASLWTIPLLTATNSTIESPSFELMSSRTHSVTVPLSSKDDWVKINAGQHTLMRVLYTPEMVRRLKAGVTSKELPPEDRSGLIQDAFALTKAGMLDAAELLRLLAAYRHEDNTTVWEALQMVTLGLDKALMESEDIYKHFCAFVSDLIKPTATAVGWEPKESDGHLGKLLRGTMIQLLGRFGWADPEVQEQARSRFAKHYQDPEDHTALPSEYAVPVYKIVLKSGGEAEYKQLMDIEQRTDVTAEKKLVYSAIGAAPSVALKKRVLEWAVTSIKLQDFFYPFASVSASGKDGLELAWQYFQDNLERIKGMLKQASPSLLSAVIVYCCGNFCDTTRIDEVEAFFKAHPLPDCQRKITQMLEASRINAKFLNSLTSSALADEAFWKELS